MDPTECLYEFLCALHERDFATMEDRCADLIQWLEKGGFQPNYRQAFSRFLDNLLR
jgi:hypothetical protein